MYCSIETASSTTDDKIFLELPYLGEVHMKTIREITKIIQRYYPDLSISYFFKSNSQISNFFSQKDRIPDDLRANIVYNYTCDACQAAYIGSSVKQSRVRFFQHMGVSHRTNLPLSNPVFSAIRDHCNNSDHPMKISNFKIISSACTNSVRILESLHIKKNSPQLNSDSSAAPLLIFWILKIHLLYLLLWYLYFLLLIIQIWLI